MGKIKNFFKKVGDFFKNIWKSICSFFKKVKAFFDKWGATILLSICVIASLISIINSLIVLFEHNWFLGLIGTFGGSFSLLFFAIVLLQEIDDVKHPIKNNSDNE